MRKLLALAIVAGAAFVAVPAHADESCTAVSTYGFVCTEDNGAVVLQGADTNPSPFSGYISVNDSSRSNSVACVHGDDRYNSINDDQSCESIG